MNVVNILVLICNNQTGEFEYKTDEINTINQFGNQNVLSFYRSDKIYKYAASKVLILKSQKIMKSENAIISDDDFPIGYWVQLSDF